MGDLTVVPAPAGSAFVAWDCHRCDALELLHPVFLSDGRAYGTGCAAVLVGATGAATARLALAAEEPLAKVARYLDLIAPSRVTAKLTAKLTAELHERFAASLGAATVARAVALWKATRA